MVEQMREMGDSPPIIEREEQKDAVDGIYVEDEGRGEQQMSVKF